MTVISTLEEMEIGNARYEVLLSAEEARTIVNADVQERIRNELVKLSNMIRFKAKKQERSLFFQAHKETYKDVLEALKQKGYQIEIKNPERYIYFISW